MFVLRKVLKVALITAAFATVTGCAAPTVNTNVAISSKLSMTPDLNPGLHAMPDWGDKIAVVPASGSKKNDPTYSAIKSSLENLLVAAHLEPVTAGSGEKYRMSVSWSVKPSRIIRRSEQVPVTVMGGGFGYPFLLLYNFYLGISWTYAEAAQMDGANDYQVFLRVMFPQSVPMLVAILIMIFMGVWGNFTDILLYLPSHPTLAVGTKLLSDSMESSSEWPALFAALLVTTVPIGALYIWANKMFFNMRVATGIKG